MSSSKWERTKELLDAALSVPTTERDRFLATACAGDESLRAELESLLRAHADAGGFLHSSDAGAAAALAQLALHVPDSPIEGPGDRIGRYKLLQSIGEGGFGEVFMAEQVEPIRRMVALKIIKAGMDTKEIIARFEAERQALALMDHPNIAKVLDAGATDSGRPYFVMELVKGAPITEFCDANRLPIRTRLELFVTVCKAFDHAHDRGIVHRDIKPSNVLVTLHDGAPTPVVIDFGIAKATSQSLTERTLFTMFGQFVGTPTYMSPEQAAMSNQEVDRRSDVYSLGVLLYELMTGTTPFGGENLRSAALLEMLRAIRELDPPTPSHRVSTLGERGTAIADCRSAEPNALARFLRGDLDWIVMRAMEKDRRRRYASAGEFAADIERHFRSEPVTARKPSATYRASRFVKRHRRAVVLAVITATVGGTILASNVRSRIATQRRGSAQALLDQGIMAQNSGEAAEKQGDISFDGAFLRADSAFAEAERKDRSFVKPVVQRASLALLRSGLARHYDFGKRRGFVDAGIVHANRALVVDPTSLDALEFRGRLRAAQWRLQGDDIADARELLESAQEDLDKVTTRDRTRARAWVALSSVQAQLRDIEGALISTLNAYDQDAWFPGVDVILRQLFATHYDREEFDQATKWCKEGFRRFPNNWLYVSCQMAMRWTNEYRTDIDSAWRELETLQRLLPENARQLQVRRHKMLVAATIARNGLRDSAVRVIERARTEDKTIDPNGQLLTSEALIRVRLNTAADTAEAFRLLREYVVSQPSHAKGFQQTRHWWWKGLRNDARWNNLLARAPGN